MLGIIGAFCCLLYAFVCWLTGDTTSVWMAFTVSVVCLLLTLRRMSASTPASRPTPRIDWNHQPYRIDSTPTGSADPFYGYDDANSALDGCRPRIHGTPGFGLESTRRLLPGCTVGAWVLLTRTPHGTFGVSDRTLFPGGINVTNADVRLPLLRDMLSRKSGHNATVYRTLDALVKR